MRAASQTETETTLHMSVCMCDKISGHVHVFVQTGCMAAQILPGPVHFAMLRWWDMVLFPGIQWALLHTATPVWGDKSSQVGGMHA